MGRSDPRPASDATSLVVAAIAIGAALAAALSDAEPTGSAVADAVWCALAGAAVTWAASRADRLAVAWLGAVAAVVGVAGGWLAALCGLGALVTGIGAGLRRRPDRELAALAGALAVQALLRGPSYGFVGLPTLVAVLAVVPAAVTAWRGAPRGERRVAGGLVVAVGLFVVVASLGAGVAAALARPDLQAAGDHAEEALQILRDGEIDDAVVPLDQATGEFASSADQLDGPLALAGRVVPIVGQHVDALRRVARAGEDLTATAGEAATAADYEALKADNGSIDLAQVRAMAGPVRDSADAVVSARRVVADVRSPWLVGPVTSELDRLDDELADSVTAAVDAAEALEVAPALLGGDGPRRYLLMFATPGEARNAGGFVGSYGALVAEGGQLRLETTGSTSELGLYSLDDIDSAEPIFPFVPPPGWEELYGRYRVDLFPGNVSASPDWPTDADVARQIFAQVPGVGDTDGVLYADPRALAALLQLTGPVEVPSVGLTLDETNVEQYLYEDQYVQFESDLDQRRDVLTDVTRAVFDALTSRPLPAVGDITDALGPVVAGGHLKFTVLDEGAEALFVRTGLAGAWSTRPGADWVSVRSINLLPNKIDWFVRRQIDVDSVVDPATGAVESTVTVALANLSPPGGLPNYIIANTDGLPHGTSQDGISLYTPHGLVETTIDGAPAGVERQQGYGGNIYTVPVTIGPGGAATVQFRLTGRVPASPAYLLDVLAQPLAHDDQLTVTLRAPDSTAPATLHDGPLVENLELTAIGR